MEAQTISVPRRRYGKLQAIWEKVSQAHSQPIILSSLILTPEQPMLPLFVQLAKLGLNQVSTRSPVLLLAIRSQIASSMKWLEAVKVVVLYSENSDACSGFLEPDYWSQDTERCEAVDYLGSDGKVDFRCQAELGDTIKAPILGR